MRKIVATVAALFFLLAISLVSICAVGVDHGGGEVEVAVSRADPLDSSEGVTDRSVESVAVAEYESVEVFGLCPDTIPSIAAASGAKTTLHLTELSGARDAYQANQRNTLLLCFS